MSLLSLPAFLTRRREDTPMPETETTAPLMRFLTQGGAQVHVTRIGTYTVRGASGHCWGEHEDHWTCHGCDQGIGSHKRFTPRDIRDQANEHANDCRAMPKPEV